jgi:hypothetical protein
MMQKRHPVRRSGTGEEGPPLNNASGSQEYTQLASENLPYTVADRIGGIKNISSERNSAAWGGKYREGRGWQKVSLGTERGAL